MSDESKEYQSALRAVHKRSAQRILNACLKNGGLYIKLGQGLVTMNHILPREYLDTLVVLQDKVPTRQPHEVRETVVMICHLTYSLLHYEYLFT